MDTTNNPAEGKCPLCCRELFGVIEITETETEGIPTILLKESSDRNWIECDVCSFIVCKKCCENFESGLCNQCQAERFDNAAATAENLPNVSRSISGGAGQ